MVDIKLTDRDLELLKAIGKYIQTSSVDWSAVAQQGNYKTAKAARDKWYPLRDKLFGADGGDSNGTPKKTATPRKRKTADTDDATPARKKTKAKKAASEDVDDDEDGIGAGGIKSEPSADGDEDLM